MQISATLHCFGTLLLFFSSVFLIPLTLAFVAEPQQATPFLYSLLITAVSGIGLAFFSQSWQIVKSHGAKAQDIRQFILPGRGQWQKMGRQEGFLLTTLFWCGLSAFGSLPFYLTSELQVSFNEALFESVSGLTTTGATVLTGLDDLSRTLLLYRQLLQWVGGIGLVLIAIAILPILGIGGMQLYRAEAPGPFKDAHLKPSLIESIRWIFILYLWLTILCAIAYFLAGMSLFDAICHSMSTVSVGGFSTHDNSFGYFADTPAVFVVAMIFMVISAISYALHFRVLQYGKLPGFRRYWSDAECRFFFVHILLIVVICVISLAVLSSFSISKSILNGAFQAISIATTTGYTSTSFALWPFFLPFLLFSFAFIGGCSGSTAGGLKAVRVLLVIKEGLRELHHLIHPRAVVVIKLGHRIMPDKVMRAVWSFMGMYMVSFVSLMMILLLLNLEFETAFYAVAATLNNIGPGLGEVSENYQSVSDGVRWVLCLSMLLGRLEILSLLVLFSPAFWRT